MVKSIIREIQLRQNYLPTKQVDISTIYFGGGTPSILEVPDFKIVFESLRSHFNILASAEITIEANPEDITKEKLWAWNELGINRLSIGVQSFIESELRSMNRNHSADQSKQAINLALENGFANNISVDLIFGVQDSNLKKWEENLGVVCDFKVPHLSCYALTVEENTALDHQIKKGKSVPLDDSLAAEQFLMTHNYLESKGYLHYEISNYAMPAKEAIHNTNYWRSKPYVGFGPSAHSFDGKTRQWNVANNALYIKGINKGEKVFEKETLSSTDLYNEYLMFGLRTRMGCNPTKVKQFGNQFLDDFIPKAEELIKDGILVNDQGNYLLSTEALLLSDGIISKMFYED